MILTPNQGISSISQSSALPANFGSGQPEDDEVLTVSLFTYCSTCQDRNGNLGDTYCLKCGVLLPLTPGYALGRGRYIIQRVLGQGGMGRVYLAKDRAFQNQVVIKELLDEKNRTWELKEEFRQRLAREAEFLASLNQLRAVPRLVQPVVFEGPRYYYVMEYIDGTDLDGLVTKASRPLPVAQVVSYALEILEILKLLHGFDPPLVHRDLKPQNLRRRHDGSISLLDFGIARQAQVGASNNTVVGTPGYTSPEQLAGNAEPRSDLYSLAATMFFLLTQTTPSLRIPQPGDLRKLNPEVSLELEQIILVNLHPDPFERHNNAAELINDLRQGRLTELVACPTCRFLHDRREVYCRRDGSLLLNKWRQCQNCHQFIPLRARFCPKCSY